MLFGDENHENEMVYSTSQGKTCPKCEKAIRNCVCNRNTHLPQGDGVARVSLERKGRKGKGVTVITGIPVRDMDELKDIAKKLKQKCATGGTVKNNSIEIQGDSRDTIVQELLRQGYKAKRAGG